MSKGNRIILGIVILMFVGAIIGCGGMGIRAEALTTMSPTYRPQGNYTWVSEGAYGASSQGSGSGYALKQASTTVAYIYIMNEGAGDMQDLEYGTLLSMAEYNIVLFEMGGFEVTSTRFVLKRNGVSIVDLGDLGTGGMPLFSGALQDGEYNFIYECSYRPNQYTIVNFVYEFGFSVDGTAPSYSLTANGNNIPSGSYTSAQFKYIANDNNFSHILYYAPAASNFVAYTSNEFTVPPSMEGLWRLKAVDFVGNISEEVSVIYDKTLPVGNIYTESGNIWSAPAYNKKIRYAASDNVSLDRCESKLNSGVWLTYTQGTYLSAPGIYSFRSFDKAGNVSVIKTIVIDTVAPALLFKADGQGIAAGSEVSAQNITLTAEDSSGIDKIFVMTPGTSTFQEYFANTQMTGEGKYQFYARDKAGNSSEIKSIWVDRGAPEIYILSGNDALGWETPTNRESIRMVAEDTISNELQLFVRKPGENISIYNGENLVEEGEFMFYALDKAGNKSLERRVVRDGTAPTILVVNSIGEIITGGYLRGNIRIQGEDQLSGLFEIRYKSEGMEGFGTYGMGTLLNTEGEYRIYALDNAGNQTQERVVYLDNTLPEFHFYGEAGEIAGEYTSSEYIVCLPTDEGSGIKKILVKKPGESGFQNYVEGSELSAEGKYFFYIEDNVLNAPSAVSITVDRTSPSADISLDGILYPSGTVSSKDLTCYGTDNVDIVSVFVKEPGSSEYTRYLDRVIAGREGEYSFYVVDASGNESIRKVFIIDKSAPIGMIVNYEGDIVSDRYINYGFKYISEDGVEVVLRQFKGPGSQVYIKYEGDFFLGVMNGEYFFRSIDSAGNISSESSIVYDDLKPVVSVYNERGISVGRYASTEYMTPVGEDISGIINRWVVYPGNTEKEIIQENARFYGEGTYSFSAEDEAGNVSDIFVVTLDRTPPEGRIYINGSLSNSYEYVNGAFSYEGTDAHSFAETAYIKKPNSTEWEPYIKEEHIFEDRLDGDYFFKCQDAAGNMSEEISLYYDSTIPEGRILVPIFGGSSVAFPEGYEIYSGNGYTRAESIAYHTEEINLDRMEVCLPGQEEYVQLSKGSILVQEGRYIFRCYDLAGNVSLESEITVDRTPDYPKITGIEQEKTTGRFLVEAEEGSLLKVNNIEVVSGVEIACVYEGRYLIYTKDIAGNEYAEEIKATYRLSLEEIPIKEWYECEVEGEMRSFDSREYAIEVLGSLEVNTLIEGYWSTGEVWNTGIMMDPVDSIYARPGLYYIYKSANDPEMLAAYFTEQRLIDVITSYVEIRISKHRYFEKTPAREYHGQQIYQGLGEKELIVSRVLPLEGRVTKVDGQEIFEEYVVSGSHILEYIDSFGNSFSQRVRVVSSPPSIYLKRGINNVTEEGLSGFVQGEKGLNPYYFGGSITVAISDENGDGYFFLKDNLGNIVGEAEKDGRIIVENSGVYLISALNRFGVSEDIEIYLSLSLPSIEFVKDSDAKKLHIKVNGSLENFAEINDIEIYKSLDGINFLPIIFDDYGAEVISDLTGYAFRSSGTYRVSVSDYFRNGSEKVISEVSYVKPYPVGVLSGVEEGSVTNGSVSFSWSDEATATYQRKGFAKGTYQKDSELVEDGEYTIFLSDYDNNVSEYSFSIKTSPPALSISGVENGGKTTSPVVISALDEVSCLALRNGEAFSYSPGQSLDMPGMYEIRFLDPAGNESTYSFEITENEKSNIYIYFIIAFAVGALLVTVAIIRKRTGFKNKRSSGKR